MASVKFNPAIAAKNLAKKIRKATNDKRLEKDICDFMVERVRFQARRGSPLNDNGRFPRLKESTVKSRRNNSQRKHPAFSPGKSNLTITGQLQDAVTCRRKSGGLFELFMKKSRRSERGAPNNRQLAKFLEKIGFTLFSVRGIKRDKKIARRMKQTLLRFLRKRLRKK